MPVTDPIADFLTRTRNAVKATKRWVEIPSSKMKINLAEIMKSNNFIREYEVIEDNKQNILKLFLKYVDEEPAITGLKRISTPGLRKYADANNIPRVLNGLGICVVSTSRGLFTDRQCREQNIGGELICYIW
jgi:small subunit ribosomal protein S8